MIQITMPLRGVDSYGSGAFGASRGDHSHNGVDFSAWKGSLVHSFDDGIVTKIGIAYADDHSYKYVQVTNPDGDHLRYFYVSPLVRMGDKVKEGGIIGEVQDISQRYQGITPHIHFEVKQRGVFIDPIEYLS